ncbi:hypothetical protein GGI20_004983, partial [Coemansia sp. BCRC 34301]
MQADEPANTASSDGHSPAVSEDASSSALVEPTATSSAASVASSVLNASQPAAGLPLGLLTSVGNISISGATGSEPGSGTELSLGFNVDTLNLGGLHGLDLDMASILSHVSSMSPAAFSSAAIAGGLPQQPEALAEAAAAIQTAHTGAQAEPSRLLSSITRQPLLAQTAGSMSAPDSAMAPLGGEAIPSIPSSSDATVTATATAPSQSPTRALLASTLQIAAPVAQLQPDAPRSAGLAKPARPATSPVLQTPRPRPSRPPGAAVRPPGAGPTGAAPRPAPQRPGQPVGPPGTRPRPAGAAALAPTPGAMRPGARPASRPRPPVRPAQAGSPTSARPPVAGRPVLRPGMRPAVRAALSPGGTKSSPTLSQATTVGRPGPPSALPGTRPTALLPLSPSAVRPGPTPSSTAASGAIRVQRPPSPSLAVVNPLQYQDLSEAPDTVPAKLESEATDILPVDPDILATELTVDEERYLTELVVATCPPLIAPPKGFEPLYGLEGAFRSLCHGILPSNAEWSSLNILAVTWPQLEIEPTASRRLAQRDIPDVSSMSATDSMRPVEERRPPSSAIHLYRLHVHPPPAWDAGAKLRPIQPSLLPLCDLRMQQHWDEQ